MSSVAALGAGACALVLVALALLVWQRGEARKERLSAERFIDSRMVAPSASAAAFAPGGTPARAGAGGTALPGARTPRQAAAAPAQQGLAARWQRARLRFVTALHHLATRAGIADARVPAVLALLASAALCLWAAQAGGWLAALAALLVCALFLGFLIGWRARQRRRRIVMQLPTFLDGIVRLITLGNSVPAAFQASLQTTEAPLRECLDHVSRMLRTGVEIDRALQHVARIYRTEELELLGSILRLSVKYGGRADVMLDRMASFMRDLEQAERELHAMSAEIRLSSWILALLPVGIGGFLLLSNPGYFRVMWHDAFGRELVYAAFGLQLFGSYLLYRLARLKG